ncbi:MAG: peptide deformylase [Alphaproteobacteria bacterium]
MSIRKIARMGHPVLSRKAAPVVDPAAPAVRRLIADMVETMHDAGGAGLAAPQVHEAQRIVIFHAPAERGEEAQSPEETAPLTVLVNPEIEILTDEMEEGWEGCLSVPGLRGLVPRYTRLRYRGLDAGGEPFERQASGFHARVVQHECDHLDGVLYPQRMRNLSTLIFESEWRYWVPAREGGTS